MTGFLFQLLFWLQHTCVQKSSQSVSQSLGRKVKHRKLEVRENIFFTQHYLINRYEPDFVLNPMTFTYAVVCLSVRLSIWLIIDHKVITYVWICFGGSILPTASRHVPDLLPFPELVFLLLLIRAKYTSSHVKNQTRSVFSSARIKSIGLQNKPK